MPSPNGTFRGQYYIESHPANKDLARIQIQAFQYWGTTMPNHLLHFQIFAFFPLNTHTSYIYIYIKSL